MTCQLLLSFGNSALLASANARSRPKATINRNPANVSGGREPNPTLIASHVDPQTKHSEPKMSPGKSPPDERFAVVNFYPILTLRRRTLSLEPLG
jgi:hypothetical protein